MTKIKILDLDTGKQINEPLTTEDLSELFKQMQSSRSAVGAPHGGILGLGAQLGIGGFVKESEMREDGSNKSLPIKLHPIINSYGM